MEKKNKNDVHNHCHHEGCDCEHHHNLEDTDIEDLVCDLDPTKICDNCGACISEYNTNEKGFVEIPIDKIDMTAGEPSLEDFYKMYGLDDDDENNEQ